MKVFCVHPIVSVKLSLLHTKKMGSDSLSFLFFLFPLFLSLLFCFSSFQFSTFALFCFLSFFMSFFLFFLSFCLPFFFCLFFHFYTHTHTHIHDQFLFYFGREVDTLTNSKNFEWWSFLQYTLFAICKCHLQTSLKCLENL